MLLVPVISSLSLRLVIAFGLHFYTRGRISVVLSGTDFILCMDARLHMHWSFADVVLTAL